MNTSSRTTTSNAPSLSPGSCIDGKWRILEFIAKGGMGEVYRARQLSLNREVAFKIISREWLETFDGDEEERAEARGRFQREMETMARVRHPCVVQVFDHGVWQADPEGEICDYIVMEFVPGTTLRKEIPERGLAPDEQAAAEWIRKFFLPVLEGVDAIHGQGILHRDLKPENILLDEGIPKIFDFGLARSCLCHSVTRTASCLGTLHYMPPEQFVDLKYTEVSSDIFALGKMLLEAMDGTHHLKKTHLKPGFLRNPKTLFFQAIDRIIQEATCEQAELRTGSVAELILQLESALAILTEPARPEPFFLWKEKRIAFLVAAILLMVSGRFWFGNTPPSLNASVAERVEEVAHTRDGSTLFRVALAEGALSEASGTGFYMDEKPVTWMQYLRFLNEQPRSRVRVKEGRVFGSGRLWLDLDESCEDGAPAARFTEERGFVLAHPKHACCPIQSVSAPGARAYAEFYDKALPTLKQWKAAFPERETRGLPAVSKATHFPSVLGLVPNRMGMRGVADGREWVVMPGGGLGATGSGNGPDAGMDAKVGFRCVVTSF